MSSGSHFVFRASRPALARPERSASGSDGQGAEAAARAARPDRLEAVKKFSQAASASRSASRGMLYRVPPDAGYGRNCDGVEDAAKLAEMLLAEELPRRWR